MPTYDYQCDACGKITEVFHAMSEPGPEFCDCPRHGRLHRLLSAGSGLIFKGSGFYITDYVKKGGDGSGSKGSSPAKSASPTESSSSTSGESSSQSSGASESSSKTSASSDD